MNLDERCNRVMLTAKPSGQVTNPRASYTGAAGGYGCRQLGNS